MGGKNTRIVIEMPTTEQQMCWETQTVPSFPPVRNKQEHKSNKVVKITEQIAFWLMCYVIVQ